MHTLIGLLVAAAAACVIARPPGPTEKPVISELPLRTPLQKPQPYLGEYLIPRLLMPGYFGYEDAIRADPPPDDEWLTKEIDRLNQMDEEEEPLSPFDLEFSRLMGQDPYMPRAYEGPIRPQDLPSFIPNSPKGEVLPPVSLKKAVVPEAPSNGPLKVQLPTQIVLPKGKQTFAMTPLDDGYFKPEKEVVIPESEGPVEHVHEGGQSNTIEFTAPRITRQNPNMGRVKNLVAENLGELRKGFTQETPDGTDRPRNFHVIEATTDPADTIYGVALIAAVGTALTMVVIGLGFGWYTLSKKAKAAADVDYPAYGVTGPTIDPSGDRKLAHSAHMYHYQHQKQQIIAMERNGLEQRNGSLSDPESEEENEEGDYTVYECPGFATTGEMEVKNPLFSEEPTPATPGKCELVKPQPKE